MRARSANGDVMVGEIVFRTAQTKRGIDVVRGNIY